MPYRLMNPPKTRKVTAAFAKEISELPHCVADRPLKELRLTAYERMVRAGEFRPVNWATAVCKETGAKYRVNGRHTSVLFTRLDLSEVQDLYVSLEEFECDAMEDVANLFSTYDSKLQSRTTRDINRSFAAIVPELAQMPIRYIDWLVGGLVWHVHQTAGGLTETAADKAERLLEHVPFAVWVHEIISGGKEATSLLGRVPVVGAMATTYGRHQSDATEFWSLVRDETDKAGSVTRQLAKFLTRTSVKEGAGSKKPDSRNATAREFFVRCLHAWNAWRGDKCLTQIRYCKDDGVPKAV